MVKWWGVTRVRRKWRSNEGRLAALRNGVQVPALACDQPKRSGVEAVGAVPSAAQGLGVEAVHKHSSSMTAGYSNNVEDAPSGPSVHRVANATTCEDGLDQSIDGRHSAGHRANV